MPMIDSEPIREVGTLGTRTEQFEIIRADQQYWRLARRAPASGLARALGSQVV